MIATQLRRMVRWQKLQRFRRSDAFIGVRFYNLNKRRPPTWESVKRKLDKLHMS